MNLSDRRHEMEISINQIESFGHEVDLNGLCLRINRTHQDFRSTLDLHQWLRGFEAACEMYEWEAAK